MIPPPIPVLKVKTPSDWVKTALSQFDSFLLDHASCERKASAVGMSFVVRYPDRPQIMEPMIHFAREELEHFHQVFRLIAARGLLLPPDEEDPYVTLLMKAVRFGREERFLDRLLTSSVIEARGFERLQMVSNRLEERALKNFYARLSRAERQHRDLFLDMAYQFFNREEVESRLQELLILEAKAIQAVPYSHHLH